jgi:ADP-L-glycero-D-manno-heptose 6-epimerase
MIVVTGAFGFIGCNLVEHLNQIGRKDIIAVDDFSKINKESNLKEKKILKRIERSKFLVWFKSNASEVDFVFHLGARTDTTEFDYTIFEELNVKYSKSLWKICTKHKIPFVYASSAATYGNGELGYEDANLLQPYFLTPLNPYGVSKNEFDKWAVAQINRPPFWAGMKFFNVYGPNENHKGRMASVIFHFYPQIKEKGTVTLFKSHRPDFQEGEQKRDFIHVNDVVKVLLHLMTKYSSNIEETCEKSGLYNLGTGEARSFNDLAKSIFKVLGLETKINYIDTPIDIRDKYQYFTQANMTKLIDNFHYSNSFISLESGIQDYIENYLSKR